MSKQLGYKIMGILLFIASGIITIVYTLSNVMGVIPCTVALIQGVGIESAKSFFSYIFITTNSKYIGKKFMFGALAVTALVISIVATTGFSINMSNTVKDYLMKKSDQYKNGQKFVATQGDLYEVTKKQLDDLKSQRDTQIAGMERTRDQWGKSYKTQKSIEQDKINAVASKFNSEISGKESELKTIAGTLNQKTGEQSNTQGYEALYTTLAKFVNEAKQEPTEAKTTTGDEVSFWMNLFVAVALEFFGIGFIVLSMDTESHVAINAPVSKNTDNQHIGFKPTIVTAHTSPDDGIHGNADISLIGDFTQEEKPKRIIGFHKEPMNPIKMEMPEPCMAHNTHGLINGTNGENTNFVNRVIPEPCMAQNVDNGFNNAELHKYLEYIYKNVDGKGIIPGYSRTAKELISENPNMNFTPDKIRKLKNHCEKLGIIRSEPESRKTFLLKPKEELKTLNIVCSI